MEREPAVDRIRNRSRANPRTGTTFGVGRGELSVEFVATKKAT